MTASDEANRAIVERFFDATGRGDMAAAAALMADDMVMAWPQSGEQFTGPERVLAAMAAVEQKPEMAGEPRLIGSGDVWVFMVPLRYGETDLFQYVAVLELEDGRIRRATGYWGAPFPPQASRAQFTDDDGDEEGR